jgi:hypothetical protein
LPLIGCTTSTKPLEDAPGAFFIGWSGAYIIVIRALDKSSKCGIVKYEERRLGGPGTLI